MVVNPSIDRFNKKLDLCPRRSIRNLSRQLEISKTPVWRILKRQGTYKSCVYQQDEAPPHCSGETIQWLMKTFGEDSVISRNSSFNWPSNAPDLNLLDFYLWRYVKSKVYSDFYPSRVEELKKNIVKDCQ